MVKKLAVVVKHSQHLCSITFYLSAGVAVIGYLIFNDTLHADVVALGSEAISRALHSGFIFE